MKMKVLKTAVLSMIVIGFYFTLASAAGDEVKGKTLFNDPKFAGGKKACSSCHPNGKDLEDVSDKLAKKELLTPPGKKFKTLEETVNFCIENAIMGKAIDPKSDQMKDIVAYIMSLKGVKMKKEMPMKEMPMKKEMPKTAPGY